MEHTNLDRRLDCGACFFLSEEQTLSERLAERLRAASLALKGGTKRRHQVQKESDQPKCWNPLSELRQTRTGSPQRCKPLAITILKRLGVSKENGDPKVERFYVGENQTGVPKQKTHFMP